MGNCMNKEKKDLKKPHNRVKLGEVAREEEADVEIMGQPQNLNQLSQQSLQSEGKEEEEIGNKNGEPLQPQVANGEVNHEQIEVDDVKVELNTSNVKKYPMIQVKSASGNVIEAQNKNVSTNSIHSNSPAKVNKIKTPVMKAKEQAMERKGSNNTSLSNYEEASNCVVEHRKKYTAQSDADEYFTPEQIEYYKEKFSDKEISTQSIVKEWKVLEEIGRGSFGSVFSAFDSGKGRPMAVKQMLLQGSQNQGNKIDTLALEIDCLSKLNHPNIVAYYGSQKIDDKLNIFLEYVGGGSLESALKEYGGLGEKIIKKYTKQILDGLEYLHYKKIIHRDIKAANILVNKGVCKLTDFGASKKIIEDMSGGKFKSFVGTPYWMAPEVITQQGHNRFADIWSLGCTVYEMLTGRPPWSDCNEFAAMAKIVKGDKPPQYPENTSLELQDFLNCCFKKNPSDRLNAYELLRHPFLKDMAGKKKERKASQYKKRKVTSEKLASSPASEVMKKTRKVSFYDGVDNLNQGQPAEGSKEPKTAQSILKNKSPKNSPERNKEEASPSDPKVPISEYQNEQIKKIYQLVAMKKIKLEDAFPLLPESEVVKIKKISQEYEEKKKKELQQKEKSVIPDKRRSMVVQNNQGALLNRNTRLQSRINNIKCIKEEYTEEDKSSVYFKERSELNSPSKAGAPGKFNLQAKSGFSNADSSKNYLAVGGVNDSDSARASVNKIDVIEEEHKLSYHSSTMNESDFDNLSSCSSVSENEAEMLGENKEVQRSAILDQIKNQMHGKKPKHDPKKAKRSIVASTPNPKTAAKMINIFDPKENTRLGLNSGNLANIDEYRKSDKMIQEIIPVQAKVVKKEETHPSLDEEAFDNMSDSDSEDGDSENMSRGQIESMIKGKIAIN